MSNYPDGERQFRADLVSEMVRLMRQQRAPWQRADRADLSPPGLPYNGVAGAERVFSSTNALTLIAAMQALSLIHIYLEIIAQALQIIGRS